MKKQEEIVAWLKKQPWYDKFVKNVNEQNDDDNEPQRYIDGSMGLDTIMYAFFWARTNEGYKYWCKINDDFDTWYREDEGNKN